MIRLKVPGTLSYRNIAVRVVTDAVKRVGRADVEPSYDGDDEFEAQAVSAFGEAFNNIAIHGYRGVTPGDVDISIALGDDSVTIEMIDSGHTFDPAMVPAPELDELPEGGMGLFIMRSFLDEIEYVAGPPNRLRMTKRRGQSVDIPSAPESGEGAIGEPPPHENGVDSAANQQTGPTRSSSNPPRGPGQAIGSGKGP